MNDPETLRLYASIFLKPRRHHRGDVLHRPSEACVAAAAALMTLANIVEAEPEIAKHYGELGERTKPAVC